MTSHTITHHLFSVGFLSLLLGLDCMYGSFQQNIGVLVDLLCNKKASEMLHFDSSVLSYAMYIICQWFYLWL